jgi:fructose-1,6-bisphosphatase/inositol monophosphatase family enzyme
MVRPIATNWNYSLFNRTAVMADDKMKSEDMVPQADKQAHTEIAEREGKEGEQTRVINKEKAEEK